MISLTNRFEWWNYPPNPSETAKGVLRELYRLGRDKYNIEGPAQEFRVSRAWIDIAYIIGKWKIGYEIDGPDHDDPERKAYDKRRDAYLKSCGWIIIRISCEKVDREGYEAVAEWIIKDLLSRINSTDKDAS